MGSDRQYEIQVSCGLGLAPGLAEEISALGLPVENVHETGVQTIGTLHDAMRMNLHLRTAYNVMLLLKRFRCRSCQQLYEEVGAIPWEQMIPNDGYISVVGRIETPSVDNTMYANVKTKDAIVDRLVAQTGRRPDSGKERTGLVFRLFWKGDEAWLYLDTSGQKLSDRGYRKMPHKAPMREALAAAVMTATGYDGTLPLVNPMCGSGTLAIEAALLATGKAPGLLRSNYAFMYLRDFDADAWQAMRAEALKESRRRTAEREPAAIIASDIDPAAVRAAQQNARTAGVEQLIDFHVCDFAETPLAETPGIIVMNPEYGSRMGEVQALEATYRRIGDFFKQRCAGWTGYVFTGNLDLAKKVHLRTSRRMPFYNADIECRLLKYELYAGTRRSGDHETAD